MRNEDLEMEWDNEISILSEISMDQDHRWKMKDEGTDYMGYLGLNY